MALPEDYLDISTNDLWIRQSAGSGAEAEVYLCARVSSGFPYALRLEAADDELWAQSPMVPPRNGAFERTGVQVVWEVTAGTRPGHRTGLTRFFRVVDGADWVPLSAPYRNRRAIALPEISSAMHTRQSRMEEFSAYEDWLLVTAAELAYGDLSPDDWEDWACLVAAPSTRHITDQAVRQMTQDADRLAEVGRVLDAAADLPFPPFTENRLLWACILAADSDTGAEDLKATLHCPRFRLNGVSVAELMQFEALYRMLDVSPHYASDTAEMAQRWTAVALELVTEEAFEDSDDWELVETAPPTVEDDWLVVQEWAAGEPLG